MKKINFTWGRVPLSIFMLFFVGLLPTFAQIHDHEKCGTMSVLEQQLKANPALKQTMEAIERQTQDFVSKPQLRTRAVITIPVVVHIVYRNAAENISNQRVLDQLTVLNADFRKLNADVSNTPSVFQSAATDAEINFCLAQRDPNDLPTTGIMRYATTRTTAFTLNNESIKTPALGGVAPWTPSKYLNIWVGVLESGILGYAQFPGGPVATDGIAITTSGFGTTGSAAPYNLGRTTTHEVGHYLNLRHIWGDANCGNDLVSDTPTQAAPNFGCPSFPHVTCSNGPNGDMFMNYMDYTNDACMFMFSNGQKARMQATLAGSRAALAASNGCIPPPCEPLLTGLSAEKLTSCAGECVNFFVTFDYVNGSNGSAIINYTLNGVAQTPITVAASANPVLLRSVCASTITTLQITSVISAANANCPQTAPLPGAVTVTVSPVPVVTSITTNIDQDAVTPGVQVCEDPAQTITLGTIPALGAFTYQWKKDGVNIPGATLSSYSFQATAFAGTNETAVFEVMVMSPGCINTASKTINVTIFKKPILNLLAASKTLTCEGECINFEVGFDPLGASALVEVTYTINGVVQPIVTVDAGENPTFLKSFCRATDYTVAIIKVARKGLPACVQTAPFPVPVTVIVRPTPVVNTLTSNVDEDAVAPDVQKCEDPAFNITLTALPTHPTFTYIWKKNGVIIPNATSNTYTFPATLTDQANVSETSTYQVMVMSSTCPGSAFKNIDVTIFKKPVGGTVTPALTKVCGALPVTLTVSGYISTVRKWQKQIDCTGPWIDIVNATPTLSFTTVPNTITCYRAVIGNGTCPDVFSTVARVEADAPAVGGFVGLASNPNVTMAAICPNRSVDLKVYGIVGKVINWQLNPIASPAWINIAGTANQMTLTVNGSTLTSTTFYRACICSPLSICTGPAAFAYSSAFKVSLKSNCAPPPPAPALAMNNSVPGNDAIISKAFPIPSNHRVTLEIEGASEGDAQIQITDMMGKVAIKETKFLQFGTNEVSFDISNLSNGIYIVKFMDSEKHTSSIKIAKTN
jgi:Pregnancy-associated plasma protein-A/Secretion system C-terminal sorting domain